MGPKVYGKLLTLHRKGKRFDADALVIESSSGGMPEKTTRWDLTGTEGCGLGKSAFVDAFGGLGIYVNI